MAPPGSVPDDLLARWLAAAPTDEESARAAVAPYRHMDAAARWRALEDLLREIEAVLGDRLPVTSPDDEAFWRHGKDPALGRPA